VSEKITANVYGFVQTGIHKDFVPPEIDYLFPLGNLRRHRHKSITAIQKTPRVAQQPML
jgi:hypothetical protein